ncbi:MAG: hypothetical protein VX680_05895, partial [Candidatus Neomarinimicrobiota bacterium]|nr:hypothetical protein [Candidatus Neomarinimicrobiota bacterium]
LDGTTNLIIDGVAPDDLDELTGPVVYTARGGTAHVRYSQASGSIWELGNDIYWNTTHESLIIKVPLPSDISLSPSINQRGLIQLKADLNESGTFIDFLDPITIEHIIDPAPGPPSVQIIQIPKSSLVRIIDQDDDDLDDGSVLRINAYLTDYAGNSNNGYVSDLWKRLIVDYTLPNISELETPISVDLLPSGPNSVTGYWNSINESIRATVYLEELDDSDLSLYDGRIDLLARNADSTFWDTLGFIGSSENYIFDVLSNKIVEINDIEENDNLGIEEISGFSDIGSFQISAVLYDRAGNPVNFSSENSPFLSVDTIPPTIDLITSSNASPAAYGVDEQISISVISSESLVKDNELGDIYITLNANPINDAKANYENISNNTINFIYTIGIGHSTEDVDGADEVITDSEYLNFDNNGIIPSAFYLDQPYLIRDLAGNNLDNNLNNANPQRIDKEIVVDTHPLGVSFDYDETELDSPTDGVVSFLDNVLIVTANFTDSTQTNPTPTLDIDFPPSGTSPEDLENVIMERLNSTSYYYYLDLINDPNIDGIIEIYPTAYDKAQNPISVDFIQSNASVRLDNIKPIFDELLPIDSSYINSSNISFQLSETVESGQSSWTRVGGNEDINSPYLITFNDIQLEGNQVHSITDPINLVDGGIYDVLWTATDVAGNISNDYVSTNVTYDMTLPTAVLEYSRYIVSAGYLLTITATFSEPIKGSASAPLLSIDYNGNFNDLIDTLMVQDPNTADSTVWIIDVTIPSGPDNSGVATVAVIASDCAGNELDISNISNTDTLLVDNLFPSCRLDYVNLSQNWLINEGRGGDLIQLKGDFNKPINISIPLLDVRFSDSTNSSFIGKLPDSYANGDSTYIWSFTLPDNLEDSGFIVASITAFDSALTALSKDSTNHDSIFVVDNIFPSFVETGRVNSVGYNNNPSWINAYTDSIEVIGDIPVDSSLLDNRKGGIDFQALNKNRGSLGWVTISNMDSPYGDSLQVFGSQIFS